MQPVSTDEHWQLTGFSYHDGRLDAVVLEEDGAVIRLFLRSYSGTPHKLVLRGVSRLAVDGFREGNIILLIRALPASKVNDVPELLTILRERFGRAGLEADDKLFVLDPSFGASIVAVCRSIEVE